MFATKNIDGTSPWDVAKNPNSCMLEYAGGESVTNMLNAIEAFILAHGWVLHDASAGTNARAYKSLCGDGVNYKYVVLDANTANTLFVKNYESWNAATHAGTNLAYLSDGSAWAQRHDLANQGKIYVFSHARWLMLYTSCSLGNGTSTGTAPTGVFETEQAKQGIHPFCLWVALARPSAYGAANSGPVSPYRVSASGATGAAACTVSAISVSFGYGGQMSNNSFVPFYSLASLGAEFASNKRPIGNMTWLADPRGNPCNISRIAGLKMAGKNAGSALDELTLDCDSEFYISPAGADLKHRFFPESQYNFGHAVPV